MANYLGNFVDKVGTALRLPEYGLSERLAGNQPTANTGLSAQSRAAGYTPYTPANYSNRSTGLSNTSGYQAPQGGSIGPQMGGGSVMGASTGGGAPSFGGGYQAPQAGGYQQGPDPQQQMIDSYRSQQEGAINSQYNQYRSYLDQMIGGLPGEQQNLSGQLESQIAGQQSSINTTKQGAMTDLSSSEGKVKERQVSSFQDLAENLRNSLDAANQVLGSRGASDSSAGDMYSYALAKASNKQRGEVQKQTNSTLADIDARREKVNQVANDQLNQLNSYKSQKLLEITQYINDRKSEIQQMIASGEMDRGTAMRELNAQVFAPAMQRLQQIDAEVKGYRNSITQWGMERMAALQNYQGQAGQLSQVNIPQYVAQSLNYLPQFAQAGENLALTGMAPGLFGKRPEDQLR